MDRVTKVGHPPELKKSPDLSMTVKQFSLTKQNDYSGHESTKIRMVQIFLKQNCLVVTLLFFICILDSSSNNLEVSH